MTASDGDLVELDLDEDGLARLRLGPSDEPPVLLTRDLLAALDHHLGEVEAGAADGRIRAVLVQAGSADSFSGGSDLRPIRGLSRASDATAYALEMQRVLRRLEELRVPTIAVLHGSCLGAGLEIALACSYRIASDSPRTRLGLPDVKTGLIPGFGATVRLPRLVGVPTALEMIVGGQLLDAAEALRIGLVDAVHPLRLLAQEAAGFARQRAERVKMRAGTRRRVRRRVLEDTAPGRRLLFLRAARRLIPTRTPPEAAARRALQAIAEGIGLPLDRAFLREAEIYGQLAVSAKAQALIHTQLLLRSSAPTPASAPLDQAAVLGAGTVGTAFAYLLARGQIPVRVKDRRRAAMAAGVEAARDRLTMEAKADRGREEPLRSRITPATGFGGFGTLDLLAIAVGDGFGTVRAAVEEAEEHTGPGCLFALTSPLISIGAVQRGAARPERMVGYHLAEPVTSFPLVEIVRGAATSRESIDRALDLARRTGRTPVLVADRPGFLLPRLLGIVFAEALRLLDEGASVTEIDTAIEEAGFALGPFRRMDGLEKTRALRLIESLAEVLGDRFAPAPIADLLRTLRDGFYLYRNGRPIMPNPGLPRGLKDLGPDARELMRDRMLMLLINEAALALGDGVAEPDAIDLGSVLGAGFPRALGGVLHYAAGTPSGALLQRLDTLAARFGPRFATAPLLHRIAGSASGHSG